MDCCAKAVIHRNGMALGATEVFSAKVITLALLWPKDDREKSLIELMQFFLPSPSIPFNKNLALSLFTDVLILFSSFQNKESLSGSTDLLSAALK